MSGRGAGFVADLRLLVLGVVVAAAPSWPAFALRDGAVLAGLVLLSALPQVRLRAPELAALAFALLAWLSTSWAINAIVSDLGWRNVAACAVLFVTARTVATRRRDVRGLALALLVGCAIGLYRLWVSNPDARALRLEYDSASARVGIEGLNYNALAYAFATGAAFVVLLWLTVENRSRRQLGTVALGATLLVLYAGVLLNGTRGAVVAVLLLLAWLAVSWARPRRAFRALVGLAVVANAIIFTGIADGFLNSRVGQSVRETGDLNGRLRIWPVAREAFWDRPLQGYGVDGVIALPSNPLDIAAHNVFLDAASGLGVAGLVLLVAVLVLSIRDALGWESPRRYVVVGAYVAVLTPIAASGYWIEAPVLWLSLAVLSRLSYAGGSSSTGTTSGVSLSSRAVSASTKA